MEQRHARYGPPDRYPAPPPAGLCMSAFAVLRQGRKVLVGVPAPHPRWEQDFIPQFRIYAKDDLAAAFSTPRLPGVYLREGEHPDAALARVVREQLGARAYEAAKPDISSWQAPSDWYPGHQHWDLCFAYRVKAALPKRVPPWWRSLAWADPGQLRAADLGWNGDLMVHLGLAQP